jgi:hypothetical protein
MEWLKTGKLPQPKKIKKVIWPLLM